MWAGIIEVNLQGKALHRIPTLDKLFQYSKVRKMNLSENQLSRLDFLTTFTNTNNPIHFSSLLGPKLTELNLSSNLLVRLDGLRRLNQITTLDLSKNQLGGTHVTTEISNLIQLRQLSLEDNSLENMAGLDCLTNLVELCKLNVFMFLCRK